MAYAKSCVQSAYSYFKTKFDSDLKPTVLAFKAARYFLPSKLRDLKPTATYVDLLRAFTFLDLTSVIDGLKSELPTYLAVAEDVVGTTLSYCPRT